MQVNISMATANSQTTIQEHKWMLKGSKEKNKLGLLLSTEQELPMWKSMDFKCQNKVFAICQ